MVELLVKFMSRLRDGKGNKLPEKTKVIDIHNFSFQGTLGSDEYIFNVWLKPHTGVPNRTTYSYRLKNIQQCLDIKFQMDKEYELHDDLLETDKEAPFSEEESELNQLVAERSDTNFNEFIGE